MVATASCVAFGNSSVERIFKIVSILLYVTYGVFLVLAINKFGAQIPPHFRLNVNPEGWAVRGITYAAYNIIGAVVICGLAFAAHDEPEKGKPKVITLSEKVIEEKLDGKKAQATTVEVTLEPGQGSVPHRHPGPVFGYVIEGEYEWAIDDQTAKTLKAGDTFYEPTGCLHRVSKNPGKTKTRVLAVVLHSHDTKQLSTPEPKK